MKKMFVILISLCLMYSYALADEGDVAAAVAEEAAVSSSALSLLITFLPLLLILGFLTVIIVVIVLVTKNNNKKAAQRSTQAGRPNQMNCCVCGRSLSEGYANLFTDQYGYEARVCETCWHAVNMLQNAGSDLEREDAAEYLREKLPGVAPAVAEYLKQRMNG